MAIVVLMEKKALSLVMMILVVALLATSFLQIHASSDDFPAKNGHEDSVGEACCDHCICRESNPPQCQCMDVKEFCHSSCQACWCYLSFPPQCRCYDIKGHCEKCKTTAAF